MKLGERFDSKSVEKPVFRKAITPWYDSTFLCMIIVLFSLLVLLFGITGAWVSLETPEYGRYVWMPVLFIICGLGLFVSTLSRLINRVLTAMRYETNHL